MRVAYLCDALHARVGVYHDAISRVPVRGEDLFAVRGEEEGRYVGGREGV
jgi:hypothetical protein